MSQPLVVDYDARWPERFALLREKLAAALGPLASHIEHVGSTSVPGLAAKPIIDLDLLLFSANDLPAAVERLAGIGYEYQGDLGIAGRHAFRNPPGESDHHLYLCTPDCDEFVRHVALRDYLRTQPAEAKAYGELKLDLGRRFADDRRAYMLGKHEFLQGLVKRALEERVQIRQAIEDDVAQIAHLQRDWEREGATHGFVAATEVQIRALVGPFLLVAERAGRVVGFVSAVRREGEATAVMPAGPYLEIEDLYVVPQLRGRGIGKALIDRLLAEAKAQGIQHASVYSAVKDVRRIMRFYEQAGFESWYVRMFRKL
jgi:GrpB-like predicted nucleotidyltransferase (UPF0157 family)/N-acetylglutamate synthase-like GNAT family acetyltransferase